MGLCLRKLLFVELGDVGAVSGELQFPQLWRPESPEFEHQSEVKKHISRMLWGTEETDAKLRVSIQERYRLSYSN